jgi:hypothetical protein
VRHWVRAAEAFNDSGDFGPLLDLMDENIAWTGVGEGKDAVAAALQQAKAAGWLRHETTSVAVEGSFLVATARNTGKDGSTWAVAGIAAFNSAGKITHLMSLDANVL